MKQISNSTADTLKRHLPLILANVDKNALAASTRLKNAVRLVNLIAKQL